MPKLKAITSSLTCANCTYWRRGMRKPDGVWTEHAPNDDPDTQTKRFTVGACRFNPPAPLLVPQPNGTYNASSFFPLGHEDDTCGQHSPRLDS